MTYQDILDRASDPVEWLRRVRRQADVTDGEVIFVCPCGQAVRLFHDSLRDMAIYQHGDNAEHRREFPLREIADFWSNSIRKMEPARHPARAWCDAIHEYEGKVQR